MYFKDRSITHFNTKRGKRTELCHLTDINPRTSHKNAIK